MIWNAWLAIALLALGGYVMLGAILNFRFLAFKRILAVDRFRREYGPRGARVVLFLIGLLMSLFALAARYEQEVRRAAERLIDGM